MASAYAMRWHLVTRFAEFSATSVHFGLHILTPFANTKLITMLLEFGDWSQIANASGKHLAANCVNVREEFEKNSRAFHGSSHFQSNIFDHPPTPWTPLYYSCYSMDYFQLNLSTMHMGELLRLWKQNSKIVEWPIVWQARQMIISRNALKSGIPWRRNSRKWRGQTIWYAAKKLKRYLST